MTTPAADLARIEGMVEEYVEAVQDLAHYVREVEVGRMSATTAVERARRTLALPDLIAEVRASRAAAPPEAEVPPMTLRMPCPHDPPCPLPDSRYGVGFCVARRLYQRTGDASPDREGAGEERERGFREGYNVGIARAAKRADGHADDCVFAGKEKVK